MYFAGLLLHTILITCMTKKKLSKYNFNIINIILEYKILFQCQGGVLQPWFEDEFKGAYVCDVMYEEVGFRENEALALKFYLNLLTFELEHYTLQLKPMGVEVRTKPKINGIMQLKAAHEAFTLQHNIILRIYT